MEKYETLEQALNDLNWMKINSDKILKNFFNPDNLDEEGVPEITTKEKTIIVCDNREWNSNYVIDLVSDVIKTNNIKDCKLIYINDVNLRIYIEKLDLGNSVLTNEFLEEIEREKLHPMVIVINPEKNVIVRIQENGIALLNDIHVKSILNWLNNDFCDKNIS